MKTVLCQYNSLLFIIFSLLPVSSFFYSFPSHPYVTFSFFFFFYLTHSLFFLHFFTLLFTLITIYSLFVFFFIHPLVSFPLTLLGLFNFFFTFHCPLRYPPPFFFLKKKLLFQFKARSNYLNFSLWPIELQLMATLLNDSMNMTKKETSLVSTSQSLSSTSLFSL